MKPGSRCAGLVDLETRKSVQLWWFARESGGRWVLVTADYSDGAGAGVEGASELTSSELRELHAVIGKALAWSSHPTVPNLRVIEGSR